MGARDSRGVCACSVQPRNIHGLLEPDREVLLELDGDGHVQGGFPHMSPILAGALCDLRDLGALVSDGEARLLLDAFARARSCGEPASFDLPPRRLRARVSPNPTGALILLRSPPVPIDTSDSHFWQLFEVAPLPLAVERTPTAPFGASSRFNRRFTEVFGYDERDIPSVDHWWPLAYPDPAYRAQLRDEWSRRVDRANLARAAIEPMEATVTCKDGSTKEIEFFAASIGETYVVVFSDLSEAKQAVRRLRQAQAQVTELSELLPVCAWCKKLRADHGYWEHLEVFLARRDGLTVTHGICPDCRAQHFTASGADVATRRTKP